MSLSKFTHIIRVYTHIAALHIQHIAHPSNETHHKSLYNKAIIRGWFLSFSQFQFMSVCVSVCCVKEHYYIITNTPRNGRISTTQITLKNDVANLVQSNTHVTLWFGSCDGASSFAMRIVGIFVIYQIGCERAARIFHGGHANKTNIHGRKAGNNCPKGCLVYGARCRECVLQAKGDVCSSGNNNIAKKTTIIADSPRVQLCALRDHHIHLGATRTIYR